MSSHIARKIVQSFQKPAVAARPDENLSPREAAVLELLAKGDSYKEIADRLSLALETIRMNVKHIYSKLHVHSRGEVVAKYLRR